jgi:hypothetical protein
MNQKFMNEIAHAIALFIEKHNVSNLASDEESMLVES